MKILKNTKENKFPVEIECTRCNSVMEVDRDDCVLGECGFYDVFCPVCGERLSIEDGYMEHYNEIADKYFENLTKDTICYPDTFFNFNNGVPIEDDKINEWINSIVTNLENGERFSIISSGNTCVIGLKINNGYEHDDDDVYVLKDVKLSLDKNGNMFIISDNYSDCELFRGDE